MLSKVFDKVHHRAHLKWNVMNMCDSKWKVEVPQRNQDGGTWGLGVKHVEVFKDMDGNRHKYSDI